MFAETLESASLTQVRVAALATDRQFQDVGGGRSHGLQVYRLALGLGVEGRVAQRCGILLDALQIAVDMADNLADAELDRAQGRSYDHLYQPIPADCRPALPALMLGCVVAAIHRWFPSPRYAPERAAGRLLTVLGRMTVGQGYERSDPRRIDHISGEEGRLYALPLWLDSDRSQPAEARLAAVEQWGFEFARTWQLRREVIESPDEPRWTAELEDAQRRALDAWPSFPPFGAAGLFSPAKLGMEPSHD